MEDPEKQTQRNGSDQHLSTKDGDESHHQSRRVVLQNIAGVGLAGLGLSTTSDVVTAAETSTLGTFEDGLDGWKSNGGIQLRQVTAEEQSAPVTEGTQALEVTSLGDPQPIIRNQRGIRNTDLTTTPYLLADVLPGEVGDTDSPVTFQFRYTPRGSGTVTESPPVTISQRLGGRLAWDMSTIADSMLANPHRLEITWYLADNPPDSGPQGRGPGTPYNGSVFLDNIRLVDNRRAVATARWVQKLRQLTRENGNRVDTVIEDSTNTEQTGTFIYADGTEVAYTAQILADGAIRVKIDGARIRFPEAGQ